MIFKEGRNTFEINFWFLAIAMVLMVGSLPLLFDDTPAPNLVDISPLVSTEGLDEQTIQELTTANNYIETTLNQILWTGRLIFVPIIAFLFLVLSIKENNMLVLFNLNKNKKVVR